MQEKQETSPENEVADKPTADSRVPPEQADGPGLDGDGELLDELAHSKLEELLAELARSQLEVKRMLGMQSAQAQQLGGLKEQLAAELEALKQQLSSLNGLEGRLDASESILDATEDHQGRQGPGEARGGEGEDADADPDLKEDYNPEEIAELQAKLDADLADMFSQLQAVKSEASEVSTRKVQLERELQDLLAQQADVADSNDVSRRDPQQ
ncbi:hypothetical protein DUNSADRAFT_6832 [Dunaliella salina]|uniref:Uncharacterized protein n=1 Tax=Dunaliella salina TaxID=3046 RepID=A0ABQ7GML5_DUNSA|nr:hypothetical protein DUNSADRAFT_6832 [Dunaliella salina]|eukprot:KAF5835845.1 hypothetical protein DUNSADRAFT_6832 [Dunaliella salina]